MVQPAAPLQDSQVRELIARHAGPDRVPPRFKIITDTSDFFRVEYNDVVLLGGVPYWVKRYEKEGRFGIDDEPKYWVRRAIELTTGATKILKLVFHEQFQTTVGEVQIICFRSPKKEARVLDLVAGHRNFMHGHWVLDAAGNNVRILEFIHGPRFDDVVAGYGTDHHDYFHRHFPQVLDQYIELVLAIKFLHDHGEKHGDIRRDHILWDEETQANRWIDFDYNYQQGESMFGFDLQGLGNILIFLAGRGDVLVGDLYQTSGTLRYPLGRGFEHRLQKPGGQPQKDLSLYSGVLKPGAAPLFLRREHLLRNHRPAAGRPDEGPGRHGFTDRETGMNEQTWAIWRAATPNAICWRRWTNPKIREGRDVTGRFFQ